MSPRRPRKTTFRKWFLFPKSVFEGLGELFFEEPSHCVEGHVQDSFVVLIRSFVVLIRLFVVLIRFCGSRSFFVYPKL
jgi:hypothetical protein